MIKKCLVFIILALYGLIAEASGHRWQCTSSDDNHKSWSYTSSYRKMAMNKALYQCKKLSKNPESCKANMNDCDVVAINRNSQQSLWQCSALDFNAVSYSGHIAFHRDRAALSALADCKQHSKIPDSCYIHLIGCEDLIKANQ